LDILVWVAGHALPSGALAEQINPLTGEPLSVSPLTWSHATFVATVLDFIEKADMLSRAQPHAGRTAQPTLAERTAGARS
jgi:hypothetical protein